MIDHKFLRLHFDEISRKILSKDPNFPVCDLKKLDEDFAKKNVKLEGFLHQSNLISEEIKKAGLSDYLKNKAAELKVEIGFIKKDVNEAYNTFIDLLLSCPNIPDDSLPIGGKSQNAVLKHHKKKPVSYFELLNHVDLLENGDSKIFSRGAKVSQSGFIFYDSKLSWLIYRLGMIFLKHNESFGFMPVIPPYILSKKTMTNSGNLPKFEEDAFKVNGEDLYLLPTSEVGINSYHCDDIIEESGLPLRYTSWTDCFRKEAGGYGSQERGLIRIHQFSKVEIFSFCNPNKSNEEHKYMLDCAETLLQKFDLHYRVSLLATQDSSFSASKTYDIEVWLPGQGEYKEVSSVSLCTDFQSRRAKTRFKPTDGKKNLLVHTLNASSLAMPRLIVALLETYQCKKGTIEFDQIFDLIESIEK
jgi:seryl-tRNA synthetase